MRNNKDLKILVDVDGTLNEFQNHFFNFLESLGYNYDFSKGSDYHMEKGIIASSKRQKDKIFASIMGDSFFWENIPVLENAYEGLTYLNTHYDVFIVTSPWDEKNKNIKIQWMKKNFPFINPKQIIFCHDKWELGGDIIIEDKPDTLRKCQDAGFLTITKLQPYNMEVHSDYFLNNWSQIKEIMTKIDKEGM
jgi:5'(3')-deoxyribonucleotidase